MNTKNYVIGSFVVFVVMFILEFLFHGYILQGSYEAIKHILRPETAMTTYLPAMILGYLIYAFGFCFIFLKGYEGKGIGEGVRFGLYIGVFFGISFSLIEYAVFPLTGWIMLAYFIGYPIINMIIGAVFAAIYKPN